MKRLLPALLLIFGALAPGWALAQGCPGNLVGLKNIHRDFDPSKTKLGEIQLYYNPADGRNCARTMHSAATWGKRLSTAVILRTCARKDYSASYGCVGAPSLREKQDWDYYEYQAGPRTLPGRDRCVQVVGQVGEFQTDIKGFCR